MNLTLNQSSIVRALASLRDSVIATDGKRVVVYGKDYIAAVPLVKGKRTLDVYTIPQNVRDFILESNESISFRVNPCAVAVDGATCSFKSEAHSITIDAPVSKRAIIGSKGFADALSRAAKLVVPGQSGVQIHFDGDLYVSATDKYVAVSTKVTVHGGQLPNGGVTCFGESELPSGNFIMSDEAASAFAAIASYADLACVSLVRNKAVLLSEDAVAVAERASVNWHPVERLVRTNKDGLLFDVRADHLAAAMLKAGRIIGKSTAIVRMVGQPAGTSLIVSFELGEIAATLTVRARTYKEFEVLVKASRLKQLAKMFGKGQITVYRTTMSGSPVIAMRCGNAIAFISEVIQDEGETRGHRSTVRKGHRAAAAARTKG